MISKIPGWLNYILLGAFYLALLTLIDVAVGLGTSLTARFIFAYFYAGGYLAKWRERQGGGWTFW